MDLGLEGKVALVAAASQGIGAAIALALAEEGCVVELCSRVSERAERSAEAIAAATGATVVPSAVDVADADAVEAWVSEAAVRHGGLDIVIPNAGGPEHGTFADTSKDDWDAAYALTLRSAMVFAAASKPHLSDGGVMLYLTSSSVKEPIGSLLLSNVFRAGVAALAKTLATEWAGDGVRVNHLIPGRIATERVAALDAYVAKSAGITMEEASARSHSTIPLGRYGEPAEFASAAVFLVSPVASFITGATLQVDGGALRSVM